MDDMRLGHRTAQTICIKFWSSVEMQIPAVATLCALMWLFTRQGAVHLPGARDQVTEGDSLNVRRYRQMLPLGGNLDETPIWKDSRGRDLGDLLLHIP